MASRVKVKGRAKERQICRALLLVIAAWRFPFPTPKARLNENSSTRANLYDGIRQALKAFKKREVLRWLVLLETADLMMDGLHGFLALYFVDVVGLSAQEAALSLIIWTCVGLPADVLLIPLLERVRGLSYLRWSAWIVLLLYPLFLLAPGVVWKLILLGMLGFCNAGWYSILKAQLYSNMHGQSGTVMTLGNMTGLANSLIPLTLGLMSEKFGLSATMWMMLAGPLSLLLMLPARQKLKGSVHGSS